MTKNQPPSDATRQEVFSVHLRYETLRLIEQYALLLNPNKYCSGLEPEVAKAVHDGLLVAFCSHARNLLEFFFRVPDTNYYFAVATDYAKPSSYEKLDLTKDPDAFRLYKQLCAQINHLTYNRTDDSTKKIDIPECKELIGIMLREATRLASQLESGYDKQHLRIDDLLNAAAVNRRKMQAQADQPFLPTEIAGTTSTAPDNLNTVFVQLLKARD
jgi:hypothetical protein